LIDKSVEAGASGDYFTNPITILFQSLSSVTFQVEQNWIAGDIGWLSVNYEPTTGGAEVCHINEGLNEDTLTPSYSAKCYNGFAKIDLFAYDCSFVDVEDVVIPKACEPWTDDVGRKSAFHFMIPCDPDPVGCGCQEPACIPEAHLENKSVGNNLYGDTLENPVNIVHYGIDTVTFRVEQNWKEGEVAFISVNYTPVDSVETVCMSTEGVNDASSTPDYVAQCVGEQVVIDVYAYDCTFTGVPDVTVPEECKAWNGLGKTTHFQYTLPCNIMDDSFCIDESACVPEVRTDYKSVEADGDYGDFRSMPVTIIEQSGSTVDFQIDQTFKYEELGWIAVDYIPEGSSDDSTMCIPTMDVSNGESTPVYKAQCENGFAEIDVYAYDCTFTAVPDIDTYVPGTCQPLIDMGKKVHFHFTLPCLCLDSLSDMPPSTYTPPAPPQRRMADGTSATDAQRTSHTKHTNVVTCSQDIYETYEDGASDSWTDGTQYKDPNFGTFLGRLGVDHKLISKDFEVPSYAESVTVSFDFIDVDGLAQANDAIMMGVQSSFLDLQLFNSQEGVALQYGDTTLSTSMVDFSYKTPSSTTSVYKVTATIPRSWYQNYGYVLPISFRVASTREDADISKEYYGIDNFHMHANCGSSTGRRRHLEKTAPVVEDDGSFYCSSKDFPCDGGKDLVNVCHYSSRKGYETFCIPEADSEILRFYSHDYCGPCVGGFGGVNQQ